MGAEAAINAVYYNQIQKITDEAEREEYVGKLRAEYDEDIDIVHLAAELVVDAIVEPEALRQELIARFATYGGKDRSFARRRHGVDARLRQPRCHSGLRRTPSGGTTRTARRCQASCRSASRRCCRRALNAGRGCTR